MGFEYIAGFPIKEKGYIRAGLAVFEGMEVKRQS